MKLPFRLLAITPAVHLTLSDAVRQVVAAGGPEVAILLRDRSLPPDELRRWAAQLLPLCRAAGSLLLVHGNPDIAGETGVDGVHLPEDGPPVEVARAALGAGLVGVSRHHTALPRTAGADYATLSPIFPTPGKGSALGIQALAHACRNASLPVVALGGITGERAAKCRTVEAAAVAAIRAVWEGDPGDNTRQLLAD